MKVAYFAESSADQIVFKIFTEAILGKPTEAVEHAGFKHRGWPSVRTVLPAVLKELHYHTDAEGFVLAVDSDHSPPHLLDHESPNSSEPKCRLCQLRRIGEDVLRQVRPVSGRPVLKVAFGLAVPAIESWLLCEVDSHVTEAAWINGLKEGRDPYTKSDLKYKLYGTSRPSLPVEIEAMKKAAARLSSNLDLVERLFPHGFGSLVKSLKVWLP